MLVQIKDKLKAIPTSFRIKQAIGVLVGALAGYVYYIKVGCVSGTCPITSNPYLTILWGAVLGYLIADMIKLNRPKSPSE
jgi:hypothetical protein